MNKERNLIPVILAVIPLFGLLGGILLVQRNQESRRQAAAEASLSITAPGQVNVGDTFKANVLINTGSTEIKSAGIVINYQPDKLRATVIEKAANSPLPVVLEPGGIDNNSGSAEINLGCTSGKSTQGPGVIVQVSFTAVAPTETSEISFGPGTQILSAEKASVSVEKIPHKIQVLR